MTALNPTPNQLWITEEGNKITPMQQPETYHHRLLEVLKLNQSVIDVGVYKLTEKIIDFHRRGSSIWIVGNGGSASTAEHFETDLSYIRHENKETFLRVHALTANSALVTATSNDTSYHEIFKLLLKRKSKQGDLLILITASGNSLNIINAIHEAKIQGVETFSLLGFDGGKAREISDESVLVETEVGEYGIVEDIHLSICHAVSSNLFRKLSK